MKKYILICCCERDIEEPQIFDSHEEAYDAMVADFCDTMDYDDDELNELLSRPYQDSIENNSAYCTNANHNDVDWKIFAMEV